MTTDYRHSTMWRAAFSHNGLTPRQLAAYDKLAVALDGIEERVKYLLKRIPEDCRGLTVHDVSHSHQLWEVGSAICGPNYALNPLEGFVLGVAFLIHDAALTASAYPGGVKSLRETQIYKDLLAIELARSNQNDGNTNGKTVNLERDQADKVLFACLRTLHADRALHLLESEYIEPITNRSWTLIPTELLLDVGAVIGKIAAGHHWDMTRVARDFAEPLSPPAAFPGWPIDALKLACILRCADACAIDERRAPVMAFILENPRGVSRNHWIFQSYLKPGHLPVGQENLVFQSKRAMKRGDMDAWWLAYEAIMIADRELRACDRLLKQRAGHGDHANEIPLAAKRVEGAGDAALLASFITVDGWTPVDTAVRIGDPLAIVQKFGGKQLYGNDHSAPIRELIQNSADAVRMCRLRNGFGGVNQNTLGAIQIFVEKLERDSWILRICDDGIGMPAEVLIGPFIEFGKSLWRSDQLSSLYPGLASNPDFNPTGRFGIGFYASFIIGDNIKVMSKPYNGGDADRRVLHFRDGVSSRAELRDFDVKLDGEWLYNQNTVVEINFHTDEWISKFASLSYYGYFGGPVYSNELRFWEFFKLTLCRLVFCLDVRVELTCPHYKSEMLNRPDLFSISKISFAKEFNRIFASSQSFCIPTELTGLIDTIGDKRRSKSRGTVTMDNFTTGIYHIGGLTVFSADGFGIPGARYVTGVRQAIPGTVARQPLKMSATPETIQLWAKKQLGKLKTVKISDRQMGEALLSIHGLGVDLGSKYFLYKMDGRIVYFSDIPLDANTRIFLACQRHPHMDKVEIAQIQNMFALCPTQWKSKSDEFSYVFEFYSSVQHGNYAAVELFGEKFESKSSTAIGQLFAHFRGHGLTPQASDLCEQIVGTYIGPDGGHPQFPDARIKNGALIKAIGIVITASTFA